jgi:predicted kinase
MGKIATTKPVLIMLYGVPGVGKTYFAADLAKSMGAAHLQGDRIRYELFEEPRYDKQENEIVSHLMEYMAEEFLKTGTNVIFDTNTDRLVQRRALRELTNRHKGQSLIVWMQIDKESAYQRLAKRDRRRSGDKYTRPHTKETFKEVATGMQNPKNEDYVVISGKHTTTMQRSALVKKLYELGVIPAENVSANVAKPGLVNLVPTAGRVDLERRNVIIR